MLIKFEKANEKLMLMQR